MFTVKGQLDGADYDVDVGVSHGPVSGSANIVRYLQMRNGDYYAATPTGPFGQLDMDKPETVFGALLAWTKVGMVHGIAPDILGGMPRKGTVY